MGYHGSSHRERTLTLPLKELTLLPSVARLALAHDRAN
jgi:hypothetical protein